jgi:ribonuclease Z
MQITFLGTAGSWPTKERNASAIALDMESEIVLLDCGEGTQRQFFLSPASFMRVRRIFITHFHGDHFLGLPGLIQSMNLNNRTEPLDIYGPKDAPRMVEAVMGLGYFTKKFDVIAHEVSPGDEIDLGSYTVRAAAADHPVPSLSYRIQEKGKRGRFDGDKARSLGCRGPDFAALERGETVTMKDGTRITPDMVMGPPRQGRSIAYSGDTAPNEEMLRLANGVDVLIHEATTAKDLEKEANKWGHSSANQAAEIASEARVGELILTHFSSRYPDVTPLEEEARAVFPQSTAAYDLLTRIIKQR